MGQGRAMGLGLIGLGAVLGGLVVVWLVATAAAGDLRAGGIVLGLMLAAILGLPPVGAGLYVLQRSKQEQVEEAEFVGRRRVLEQDRLFRTRIASEAGQQADRLLALGGEPQLGLAAARLRQVAAQLRGSGYDQAAWYEAVKLADADILALRQYDTLVSDRLRRIAAQIDEIELGRTSDPADLLRGVQAWERDLDQRTELLRGERPPTVAPSELLKAGEPARGIEAVIALARGDAVSYELEDYLVEVTVSYFAGGRTWKLHRLGPESTRRWLYVGPEGLSLAILEPIDPLGADGAAEVQVVDVSHRLQEHASAGVTVEGAAGREQRLTVDVWHYAAPSGDLYWHERWPDGPRAYRGAPIRATALEIWPRERQAPAT